MKASPQLLMLEALVGLFEQRMKAGVAEPRSDLLLLGKQLHRLNRLYMLLVETATEPIQTE